MDEIQEHEREHRQMKELEESLQLDHVDAPKVHSHAHTHTQTKAILNRLSKAEGHLASVKRMVERGEDCTDVLVQLSAVISALNSTGRLILKDHIEHCIVDAVEMNDDKALENLNSAIDRFMR